MIKNNKKENGIEAQRYRVSVEKYEKLKFFLEAQGYYNLIHLEDLTVAGLQKYIFTTGLVTGLTEQSYAQRFCYEHESDALEALNCYTTIKEDAHGPWIKAKGLELGDRINPLWSCSPIVAAPSSYTSKNKKKY